VLSSLAIYLAYILVEVNDGFDFNKHWKANIQHCSGKPVTKLDVYQGNILHGGSVVLALSAYLGVLFKNRFVNVYQSSGFAYRFSGILIKLTLLAPLVYLSRSEHRKSLLMLVIMKTFIPTLIGGFVLFSGIDEMII